MKRTAPKVEPMRANDPRRMKRLMELVSMFPKLWRMPRFKAGSRKYPHHSDKECERRRGQLQHKLQVNYDRFNKKQPS